MFRFSPPLFAARLALHHRELIDGVDPALVAIDADGLERRVDWVHASALPTGLSSLSELRFALEDEQIGRPLPPPGDGRCFAVYLVEALAHVDDPSWVDARKRMEMVSPVALPRYLAVVGA